ncbi:MAG: hypothetical protein ACE5JX_22100 [Acidobacteriota bacterium]
MITSAQQNVANNPLLAQPLAPSIPQFTSEPPQGARELELWGEVLLRAIEDLKTYMAYRKDPKENPLSAKMVRSIVADGCDPEYWIFGKHTGFDAVCMVLNLEPDCIRRFLRSWLKETLEMEPSY